MNTWVTELICLTFLFFFFFLLLKRAEGKSREVRSQVSWELTWKWPCLAWPRWPFNAAYRDGGYGVHHSGKRVHFKMFSWVIHLTCFPRFPGVEWWDGNTEGSQSTSGGFIILRCVRTQAPRSPGQMWQPLGSLFRRSLSCVCFEIHGGRQNDLVWHFPECLTSRWFGGAHFPGQGHHFLEGLTCLSLGAMGRELISSGNISRWRGAVGPWEFGGHSLTSEHWQRLSGCFPENFDLLWKSIIGAWRMTVAMDTCWFKLSYQLPVWKNFPLPLPRGSVGPAHLGTPDYLGISTWLSWLPGASWLWAGEWPSGHSFP